MPVGSASPRASPPLPGGRASRPVSGRRTNLALLVLLVVAAASGLLMWAVGSGWGRWPAVVHGAAGVAVVALTPWKSMVSRRSIRRRGLGPSLPALALASTVGVALASGFAHRAGAHTAGPLLDMQLHVGAAVAGLPFALYHVVTRPVRPRSVDVGRRTLLRGAALAGGSAALTIALPQMGRAQTRSLEQGSFRPPDMPVTQWLFDSVPVIDGDRWRLRVGERLWSRDELELLVHTDVEATLDCTGGWYAHQRWSGVRLDRLLERSAAPPSGSVEVRSATGYRRRFPRSDAPVLVLATAVGGQPLSDGHGFPARLVAPNRRGFWWVKWVTEISVDDDPWWWQPPFPLG
jgi:DMSO/TMAO reductase YedYZ molybdopterin-dependent catalytic subunit